MRKLLTMLAIFASAAAVTVAPAGAITGNWVEDFDHDYVVLIAFYDENGEFLWRCSGSLLNSTTVLTAGHCTDVAAGAVSAIVWASQTGGSTYDPVTETEAITGYPNRCLNSPQYPCAESHTLIEYGYGGAVYLHGDNKDVGLVILDTPIVVDEYAALAEAHSADNLATGTPVTMSGYGVSDEPHVLSLRERLMATAFILNTRNKTSEFNVFVSNNPGRGLGGTCFGDSGGPLLYGDSDIILGVTSFGTNGNCAGTGYYYRIDQPDVLAWIVANADGPVTIVPLP